MQAGDLVNYWPAVGHALDIGVGDAYAYDFALTDTRTKEDVPAGDAEVKEFVKALRRQPGKRALLVPLAPKRAWGAEVRRVGVGGKLDLDVTHPLMPGLVLNYDGVPCDPGHTTPHSWHARD